MDMDEDDRFREMPTAVSVVLLLLGLVLIGSGIFALVGAILAAWNLLNHPEGISYFADYFLDTAGFRSAVDAGGQGLAHTFSWVIVALLLLLLGKLAAWAVSAGARLVGPGVGRRNR